MVVVVCIVEAVVNVTLQLRLLKYSISFTTRELFPDVTFRQRASVRRPSVLHSIECDKFINIYV